MAPARLLDLTRLVSRLGKGPLTGVDRVEYAYLSHLLTLDQPLFGLIRTNLGFLLLNRAGLDQLPALVRGETPLGQPDLLGLLSHGKDPIRARAEATLRRLAIARAPHPLLQRLLRRHLPVGSSYLNTGHANLTDRSLSAVHKAGLRITVLIHDTIPLDLPQYCRAGTAMDFQRKLAAVSHHADLVIHTTQDARAKTDAHLARLGRCPTGLVAKLGVPIPQPDDSEPPHAPYFVTLGTIEPRKNHALLLDVWEKLPAPKPMLYILGSRGWENHAVFARLDSLRPDAGITELHGLTDGAVAALLAGATAFLFPSHAEGFGIPPIEAAALGIPVISSDLPVIHELLADYAVYLDPSDVYSWLETITALAKTPKAKHGQKRRIDPPTWADHFKTVLNLA